MKANPLKIELKRSVFDLFLQKVYSVRFIIILIVFLPVRNGYSFDTKANKKRPVLKDRELQAKIEKLHNHLQKYFIHPKLHIIYDCMAPPSEQKRWGFLPTREEIKSNEPDACVWKTGMENCALSGGTYLAGMVYRYEVTGLPEHKEDARRIYQGLRLLGTVSKRKGFVARGVLPDGKTYYKNSSVDQYTMFVFGLWTYYNSSIANSVEKGQIRSMIRAICERLEKDGFDIMTDQGVPALVSDIGTIRASRSSSLLQTLLVGYEVTANKHWLGLYHQKLEENNYTRVSSLVTPSNERPYGIQHMAVFALLQNQASLMSLLQIAPSILVKAAYLEAIHLNAKIESDKVTHFRKYDTAMHDDHYKLGGWRRGENPRPGSLTKEFSLVGMPSEAMIVLLMNYGSYLTRPYSGTLENIEGLYLCRILREMISLYDFSKMRMSGCLYTEVA